MSAPLEDRALKEWQRGLKKTEQIDDTDLANAALFAKERGADIRFTPEAGWFVWDGTRWAVDSKAIAVQARAKETARSIFDRVKDSQDRDATYRHAKKTQSRQAIESMIWLSRSEPGILASLTDFDADPFLFNVQNGTVELRTGKLREHEKDDLISRIAPVTFDKAAACESWDAFLWRVLGGDRDLYDYMRRFVGHLLAGDVSDQALHFLYGLGANGKSVFCDSVLRLLGDYAIAASPDLIMIRRYGGIPNDVARLRGVRAAFMNETVQGARFDEAKLKDLTGGDTLNARFLHQEFFDFRPTHRLIIRGNHKPAITGTDDGVWRRLRLVPFNVQIPLEEQDRHLIDKLTAELPGILNWAIAGCLEWQRDGLSPPALITDAVRAYREESDVLGRFIGEHCEVRNLAQVKSSVFFSAYKGYCERAAERWIPSKDLPGEMQRRGFTRKRTNLYNVYQGLELHAPDDYTPS